MPGPYIFVRTYLRPKFYHSRPHSSGQSGRRASVDVTIGGSGKVRLGILPPLFPLSASSRVLLYLPPGALVSGDGRDASPSSSSSSAEIPALLNSLLPNSTVITLKYRLSTPAHIFPVPIHDTAVAFGHILRTFTKDGAPKISILGSRIGGTLATTLALTSPNPIHSVAVSEPIPDWVSLDAGVDEPSEEAEEAAATTTTTHQSQTQAQAKARRKGGRPPSPSPSHGHSHYTKSDAKALLALRTRLFSKPDSYFDPFASPTLFLRAPGRDCPQQPSHGDPPASPNSAQASGPRDRDDAHARQSRRPSPSVPSAAGGGEEDEEEEEGDADADADAATLKPIKRRKVLRRWPPNAPPESARLPHFQVFVGDEQDGEGKVMRQQGEELVELMRRVCFYGREREVGDHRVGLQVLPATEREEGGLLGIEQAAAWLARKQEEQD